MSLRWKLFVSLAVPVLAITAGLGAGSAHWLRAEAVARLPGELAALAVAYADRVGARLGGPARAARTAAAVLAVVPAPGEAALRELARSTLSADPLLYGVAITTPPPAGAVRGAPVHVHAVHGDGGPLWVEAQGAAVGGAGPVGGRTGVAGGGAGPVGGRTAVAGGGAGPVGGPTGAAEGASAGWGTPYAAPYAGGAVLVGFAAPFLRPPGSASGEVTVELAADRLQGALAPDPVDRFRFILVGEGGVLLSHPEAERIGVQTLDGLARELRLPALAELAARVATGSTGATRLDPYGEAAAHWAFFAPVPGTGWTFVAVAAEAELLAPVQARVRAAAIGLGVLAGALLLMAFLTASSFARPLVRMAGTARQLLAGLPDPGDPARFGSDEIGTVGRALYVLGRAAGTSPGRPVPTAEEVAEEAAERARLAAEREEGVRACQQLAQDRDQQLRAREQLARERDQRVRAYEQLAQERDEQVRAYQRVMQEREEQVREYRRVVQERDRKAEEYQQVVQERDRHAVALGDLDRERQALEGRVAEAERELARLTGRVAEGRRLQATLLAETAPPPLADPDLEVCARIEPAAEATGDFVDFFRRPDGRLMLTSGDASLGAGAGPTLAGLVRALIRRYAGEGHSPGAVLARVNHTLADAARGTSSLALFVALYRPDLGELTYANAGHRPPLLLDRSGGAYPLGQSRGRPVGEALGESYPEGIAALVGGEALVIATDGVVAARSPDGRLLGEDGLSRILTTHAAEAAQTVCRLVVAAVADHVADGGRDDVAVLVLRRPPGGPVAQPAPVRPWQRLTGLRSGRR